MAPKAPEAEMEKLSHDVLTNKSHEGIDIRITPVEETQQTAVKVQIFRF